MAANGSALATMIDVDERSLSKSVARFQLGAIRAFCSRLRFQLRALGVMAKEFQEAVPQRRTLRIVIKRLWDQ
jgi:hypothetical protein